ncbi:MAG: hypothetical protein ACJ77Z_04015 [Thermoleophilaceae bacterium]
MAEEGPQYLDLARHRDWEGRRYERWLPNTLFALICAVPVLALLNVFGQSPDVKAVANPNGAATLELSAPTTVRSGLLFEARFDIRAKREIKDAVLVLDSGWLESMTLNTLEPAPANETSRKGSLALDLGGIPAGKLWRQYLQFQVNPVNAGQQSQGVTLYDGNVPLLHLNREMTVWP